MRKPPNERLTGQPPTRAESRGADVPRASAALSGGRGGLVDGGRNEEETGLPPSRARDGRRAPERTCVLTRRSAPRDELIRLALSPDGEVLPDVRARAPGRGAWIGVARPELEVALAKGKLRGALARAFKSNEVRLAEDLPERIEAALRQAALDRLGLEAKAGNLVTGGERVEAAARAGKVELLIHAADAGADGRRRLDQAWRIGSDEEGSGRRGVVFPLGRSILSLALGRENVVHAAIVDRGAASRVARAIDRWRAFIGRDVGLEAAPAGAPAATARNASEGI